MSYSWKNFSEIKYKFNYLTKFTLWNFGRKIKVGNMYLKGSLCRKKDDGSKVLLGRSKSQIKLPVASWNQFQFIRVSRFDRHWALFNYFSSETVTAIFHVHFFNSQLIHQEIQLTFFSNEVSNVMLTYDLWKTQFP